MDKLNAISLFCKVIETQSFTQAAQQSDISLAMASKLVAQLEEHLQVRLLHRTTRKITPTEAGLLYYQHCLPILAELKDAEESISNISSSVQGKMLISLPMDIGSRFIAPHLGKFLERYPNIELFVEFNDRRVDVVSEGFDLVLRIGKLEDSSLVAKKIAEADHIIAASPRYLDKHGIPTQIDELEQHHCFVYDHYPTWDFIIDNAIVKYKPKGKVHSNNGYALVQMAKADQGIINIPKCLIKDEIEKGELVPILTHFARTKIDINLLYTHRRYLSPKVKVLIEFLAALVKEQKAYL